MPAGEEVPEAEEQGDPLQEGEGQEERKLRELSSDHRTGLAKLPNVVEWLINKLGHGRDDASSRWAPSATPLLPIIPDDLPMHRVRSH